MRPRLPLANPPLAPDRRVPIALVYTALAAVLLQHYGQVQTALALLPNSWRGEPLQLKVRLIWATIHLLFYVAIPLGLARACGVGATALGLRWRVTGRQLGLVAAVALGGLLLVFFVSRSALFLSAYPIYRPWRPGRVDPVNTVLWLAVLASYLFSIELFFRGFLLALLTPALGRYALLVMLGPYVATHGFLPEALGAIPVGLLLGVWRGRTGSLWPGYLAHLLVALEIELVALGRQGFL